MQYKNKTILKLDQYFLFFSFELNNIDFILRQE